MNQSKQNVVHNQVVAERSMDKYVAVDTAAYTMKTYEHYVEVATDAVTACTITLPPVKEARGMIYYILFKTDGGKNVTLEDNYGDAGFTDLTFTAANDYAILYSNGHTWHTIDETST